MVKFNMNSMFLVLLIGGLSVSAIFLWTIKSQHINLAENPAKSISDTASTESTSFKISSPSKGDIE